MQFRWAIFVLAACGSHHGSSIVDAGGSGGAPCDHALATASCWTTAPDQDVLGDPAAAQYAGGAYDGHYVYFAPFVGVNSAQQYTTTGIVARFDPGADFTSAVARTTFDTTTIDPNAQGYRGAVFDDRYVYFVPYVIGMPFGGTLTNNGVIARFDSTGTFTDPAAWTAFDVASLPSGGAGFRGATFDGRYVYLPEAQDDVIRYDTSGDLTATTSWTSYDVAIGTSSPDLAMDGAVFDGRYIYFIPGDSTTVIARYDTTADFSTATSWTAFDVAGASPHAAGFIGGAFDGRYLYLAPSLGTPIVRYDTQGDFATVGSWSTFDPSPLGRTSDGGSGATLGFQAAGFDGRYIYFVPSVDEPTSSASEDSGQVIVYDTTGEFSEAGAWSSFDTRTLDTYAADYFGAVFDGRYMYFPPSSIDGAAARFDASPADPPSLPQFHGSFF
ncbi:MAG TPA: hypothetical protein VGG74_18930 [Kofleriaceae bacterium]|jgi:hypothetical protein